jgi:hypothetical protein
MCVPTQMSAPLTAKHGPASKSNTGVWPKMPAISNSNPTA